MIDVGWGTADGGKRIFYVSAEGGRATFPSPRELSDPPLLARWLANHAPKGWLGVERVHLQHVGLLAHGVAVLMGGLGEFHGNWETFLADIGEKREPWPTVDRGVQRVSGAPVVGGVTFLPGGSGVLCGARLRPDGQRWYIESAGHRTGLYTSFSEAVEDARRVLGAVTDWDPRSVRTRYCRPDVV